MLQSGSMLFADMAGSRFPVAVAHGEGRAVFPGPDSVQMLRDADQTSWVLSTTTGIRPTVIL